MMRLPVIDGNGKTLTRYQCMRYALDRSGVLTILPNASSVKQVEQLLEFFEADSEEMNYSVIGSFSSSEAVGKYVYCNHCKPCPVWLDIILINKYYDLAKMEISWQLRIIKGLKNTLTTASDAFTASAAVRLVSIKWLG